MQGAARRRPRASMKLSARPSILCRRHHPPVHAVRPRSRARAAPARRARPRPPRRSRPVRRTISSNAVAASETTARTAAPRPRARSAIAAPARRGRCRAPRARRTQRRRRRAQAQQCVRPRREARRDLARHREHLAALFERQVGGDQRPAALARLDHDGRIGEPGDDPVARRETPRSRFDAGRVLGDDQPGRGDLATPARRGRADSRGRSRTRGRRPCGLRASAPLCAAPSMPAREPGDDDHARAGELAPERSSRPRRRTGARSRADDGDARPRQEFERSAPAHEEPDRRVVDHAEAMRIAVVPSARPSGHRAPPAAAGTRPRRSPAETRRTRRLRGADRRCDPVSAANIATARSLTPEAPRSRRQLLRRAIGERLGEVLDSDEVGTGESGDRPCDGRDAGTSAAGERQPLDGAGEQLGGRVGQRRRCDRQALPRSERRGRAPAPSPRPAAPRAPPPRARGIVSARSKRSSNALESRSR